MTNPNEDSLHAPNPDESSTYIYINKKYQLKTCTDFLNQF